MRKTLLMAIVATIGIAAFSSCAARKKEKALAKMSPKERAYYQAVIEFNADLTTAQDSIFEVHEKFKDDGFCHCYVAQDHKDYGYERLNIYFDRCIFGSDHSSRCFVHYTNGEIYDSITGESYESVVKKHVN